MGLAGLIRQPVTSVAASACSDESSNEVAPTLRPGDTGAGEEQSTHGVSTLQAPALLQNGGAGY